MMHQFVVVVIVSGMQIVCLMSAAAASLQANVSRLLMAQEIM